MDICHLKNAELETKHQKYKGRAVLRGCKEYISSYRKSQPKWLRELYNIYTNFMTNEDNNHDTKYTNKNDTNNHDARSARVSTAARCLVVFPVSLMMCHDPLGSSRSCVRHLHTMSSMMCGSL